MNLSLVKKFTSLLVAFALFFLSNHCLAAAIFTPEIPDHDVIAGEHHHSGEDSPADHDCCPHSKDSGPCCTTLTTVIPGLLPNMVISAEPRSAYNLAGIAALQTLDLSNAHNEAFIYNTGPPGSSHDVYLFVTSLRGPPSSTSL